MERQLLNIAIAPIIQEDKILLLKRNKSPFKGLWGMPGGKAKFGEHIESVIKREIFEETGLNVELKRILAILSEIFFNTKIQEDDWHSILFLCEVSVDNFSQIKDSAEGNLKWFDLNNLPKENIIPSDYEMIKQIVLQPKSGIGFYKIRMLTDGDKYTLDYFQTS